MHSEILMLEEDSELVVNQVIKELTYREEKMGAYYREICKMEDRQWIRTPPRPSRATMGQRTPSPRDAVSPGVFLNMLLAPSI